MINQEIFNSLTKNKEYDKVIKGLINSAGIINSIVTAEDSDVRFEYSKLFGFSSDPLAYVMLDINQMRLRLIKYYLNRDFKFGYN